MTTPTLDNPEAAFDFARMAVFRGNGYLLDGQTRATVTAQLTQAFETLVAENRADEYDALVRTYVSGLLGALPLPRDQGLEFRGGLGNLLPPSLPVPNLVQALRTLCPLWPFCS